MAITRGSNVRMSDVRTELGLSGQISVAGALSTMGESGNPDQMSEMRGYDNDWKNAGQGWLDCTSVDGVWNGLGWDLTINVRNRSTVRSYGSGITIYWRLYVGAVQDRNGNVSFGGDLSAGGSRGVIDFSGKSSQGVTTARISWNNSTYVANIPFFGVI
jgi:hypothetical protein